MNADHNFPFPTPCFSKLPLNPEGEGISGVQVIVELNSWLQSGVRARSFN